MSTLLCELREASRADESVPIYTHGEKEILSAERRRKEGIDVDVSTVLEMVNICKYLGMDHVAYLGDVDLSKAKQTTYSI